MLAPNLEDVVYRGVDEGLLGSKLFGVEGFRVLVRVALMGLVCSVYRLDKLVYFFRIGFHRTLRLLYQGVLSHFNTFLDNSSIL